jgi:3'-phosphoadenosine 5'-phosphosulfate sulfotransferase (PAPS reductase)/FAD synthetase
VTPDMNRYDVILCSISGGKDSQVSLHQVVLAASAAGVLHRVVTVFADMGAGDEWPGTLELASSHAAFYGLRHEIVRREITTPSGSRVQQTLSELIEQRGRWPDRKRRYCTSDAKRSPVYRLMTRLAAEQRAAGITGRPVRILSVLGMRAEESTDRAQMQPFGPDLRASNKTVRHVDRWLPIHDWTARQVWAQIARTGTRPHPVYLAGMPRLSCRFCPLASRSALILAARLDPEGAELRAAMEQRMGHMFRHDLSMQDIIVLSKAPGGGRRVRDWPA